MDIFAPMRKNKKGQNMNFLIGAAIGLVVLVVAVGIGTSLTGDLREDNTTVAEGEVYDEGTEGMQKFSGKFALIASVIVMVFIIGLLMFLRGRS